MHVLHARKGNGKQRQGEENYKDKGKRITWNGGTVVHGAGGSRWRWCRGSRLWWQTLVLLLLSSASLCCLLPLFFFCQQCSCLSFNGLLEVLFVLTGLLVVAKRKTGCRTRRTLLWFLCTFFFLLLSSACVSAGWFLEN